MKKILYISSTLKKSGPINQLSYLIKYLDKSKFQAIVLTLSPEPEDSMIEYFRNELEIEVCSLKLSRIQGVFFAKKMIKNFIIDNKIDLVHSQGIRADGLIININIPKVATLRNYPYFDYTMTYGKVAGFIMAYMHLNNLKKINYPVVVSESVSKMLLEKNKYKIDFVRNGIDAERFKKLDKKKLRKKLNLPLNKKIFISVGHLSNRKNPLLIINAFKKSNKYDQLLIFLGVGHLKQECINYAKNENILILGKVDNVNEYLSASDFFISASKAEGFPNTVLESFSANIPAILSSIPPHEELNKLNINCSKIFKNNNINSLVDILNNIDDYDYDLMQNSCDEIVKNYLDARIMSDNYQKIYMEKIR